MTYCYDGTDYSGSACRGSRAAGKVGRLTAAGSAVSTTRYTSFDNLGRITGSSQQTGGATYRFSYAYNPDDTLASVTYPSTRKLAYQYDAAGRLSAVGENTVGATDYASAFGYAPHGGVEELKLGNNLYEYRDYNTRLQTTEIGLGTYDGGSDKLKLEFGYGASTNNGNVLKQIITRPGLSALTQSYTYDGANRLKTAAESGAGAAFSRSYSYDAFGNRWVNAGSTNLFVQTPQRQSDFAATTNRLTTTFGASYDAAGNQSGYDTSGNRLDWTAAYDGENRLRYFCDQTAAACGPSNKTAEYRYDGEGRRVQKLTPSATETYVYDAFGRLAAEYSTDAPTSEGTFYRTTDHLGSTRLVTKQDQSDAACFDFAPFGEEIPDTFGSRSSNDCFASSFDGRHRFTGQERDEESKLDYFIARYYSGPLGRFLSADAPLVDQFAGDPQSWNLYGYVRNNPLRFVDPTGNKCVTLDDGTQGDDGEPGDPCPEESGTNTTHRTMVYAFPQINPLVGLALRGAAVRAKQDITDFMKASIATVSGELIVFKVGARLLSSLQINKIPSRNWLKISHTRTWRFGKHKTAGIWRNQMKKRGWTETQIDEAIARGKKFSAQNNVNPANPATRHVHPSTGRSVVVDDVTLEVLHVGGVGFKY